MQNQEEMPRHGVSISGLLALVFCAIAAISVFYFVREHRQATELAANNQALTANLSQVQGQLQALSDRFNALMAASQEPASDRAHAASSVSRPSALTGRPSALSARAHARAASHRTLARKQPVDDPRFGKMQQQLSEQQKQLASTREDVEKTRNELDGRLNSTRDELNGSISRTHDEIARTHDELVVLQKRGERNYYEFKLDKSKQFQRVGPVSLSLRKVNFKHKAFNLALMVDDFQLDKKNVNVFEPVWITLPDRAQPLELVVNHVTKDEVTGYVSEPKYKKSDLAASAAPGDKTQTASTPQ
jgi:hypothetical protein